MKHTLGTAAKACGKAKSTILKAIRSGKISASKNENGEWQIDPSELHRVFDPVSSTVQETHEKTPSNTLNEHVFTALERENALLRQLLDEERELHAETRKQVREKDAVLTGLLTGPRSEPELKRKKILWFF